MKLDPNEAARRAGSHLNTYHAELDNGATLTVRAESAGHAITRAIYCRRGRRVLRLWAQGREDVSSDLPQFNERMGGRIDYDVPPHRAIAEWEPEPRDLW